MMITHDGQWCLMIVDNYYFMVYPALNIPPQVLLNIACNQPSNEWRVYHHGSTGSSWLSTTIQSHKRHSIIDNARPNWIYSNKKWFTARWSTEVFKTKITGEYTTQLGIRMILKNSRHIFMTEAPIYLTPLSLCRSWSGHFLSLGLKRLSRSFNRLRMVEKHIVSWTLSMSKEELDNLLFRNLGFQQMLGG